MFFEKNFGFTATFCNPASGHEKGNVENKVGYHRHITKRTDVPLPALAYIMGNTAILLNPVMLRQ